MLTIHFAGLKNSLALMLAPVLMLVPERQAIVPSLVYIDFVKLCQLPRASYLTNRHIFSLTYCKTYILNTPKQSLYSLVKNILFWSIYIYFGIYVKWWIFKFGTLHKLLKLGNFQVLDSRVWVNYNNCTTWIYADWLSLCDWQNTLSPHKGLSFK